MSGPPLRLVEAGWLAENLKDPDLLVVDVRAVMHDLQLGYPYGHVPGAIYLDLARLFTTREGVPGRLVDQPVAEAVLGRLGIHPLAKVVIYDESFGPLAAQLAWLLDYYGHPETMVLQGGWEAWEESGGEVSRQVVAPEPRPFQAQPQENKLATADWIASVLEDPDVLLLDVRSQGEYEQGHLPGAVHVPYESLLQDSLPVRVLEIDDLVRILAEVGAIPDREIVVYCETGARSAHTYVVLRWFGYPRVRNYEGSWAEWSRREDLPVVGSREPAATSSCIAPPCAAPTAADPAALSHQEVLRYSRHLLMPEVGVEGQKKLKAASVLIVGSGGHAPAAALYLAAAGVGRIGLAEGGEVKQESLALHIAHGTGELGQPAVASLRRRMLDINPDIQVLTHGQGLSPETGRPLIAEYDLVIDGTEDAAIHALIGQLCVEGGKPHLYGAAAGLEGWVSVLWPGRGPCIGCLPAADLPVGRVPSGEGGSLGVLYGVVGTLLATEALKIIVGIGDPLVGRVLRVAALEAGVQERVVPRDPHCPLCGEG